MSHVHASVLVVLAATLSLVLGACAAAPDRGSAHQRVTDGHGACQPGGDCGPARRGVPASPSATGQAAVVHAPAALPGGRRFWVKDRRHYRSPWYAGAHRRMISFGCTAAPYYSPDPRCTRRRGFHHGLDIAMPCGTRLFSALRGRVVDPDSAGALGPSYGGHAFRIRNRRFHVDLVFGHTRRVFVRPGERVHRGQRIALASDMGAPDGCHLHFEVRPPRGSYQQAVNPRLRLRLRAVD
jgi:murein DD-endopeptidase MepM/ murein hydrolase activator NlpD